MRCLQLFHDHQLNTTEPLRHIQKDYSIMYRQKHDTGLPKRMIVKPCSKFWTEGRNDVKIKNKLCDITDINQGWQSVLGQGRGKNRSPRWQTITLSHLFYNVGKYWQENSNYFILKLKNLK